SDVDGDQDQQIEALARGEFGRPFDLTSELPMRITLVHTGTNDFVLLFVVHHICWDDDCWDVFFSELNTAYHGHQLNAPAPQYVAVEVLDTSAETTDADVEYWRTALRPLPEPVQLPGSAVVNPSRAAERRTRRLPADLM